MATIAALAGVACGAAGLLFSTDWLLFVGAVLSTPLVLGAIASILLLPFAVWVHLKERGASTPLPANEAQPRMPRKPEREARHEFEGNHKDMGAS
jgi:hypothetical protein